MAKNKPLEGVHFGKLILSPGLLAEMTDDRRKDFLRRQLLRLTPSEIGHGLSHSNGKGLLKRACEITGIDFEELRRG